jgi:hypothetical protein
MWNPPCATIIQRIVTLDKKRLIRPLSILEVPSMIRIWLNRVCLAFTVRINERSWNKVALWHGMGIRNGEWIFEDGLDGAPDLQQ